VDKAYAVCMYLYAMSMQLDVFKEVTCAQSRDVFV
jgi:hypothetical protein